MGRYTHALFVFKKEPDPAEQNWNPGTGYDKVFSSKGMSAKRLNRIAAFDQPDDSSNNSSHSTGGGGGGEALSLHLFELSTDKVYIMGCSSEKEMEEWLRNLQIYTNRGD